MIKNTNWRNTIKNLDKILNNDRERILDNWLSEDRVLRILEKHKIDIDFFKLNYASGVIDYFHRVFKGEVSSGTCPSMNNFIDYLSNENITSEEVFMICSNAKKAVIKLSLQESNAKEFEAIDEIQNLFDDNLFGVLKVFSDKLFEKEAMLLNQSKHAAMGKMMEYTTHQWKEPLALATFSISKIEYKYKVNELSEDVFNKEVENIKSSLIHMNQTINDFKDFFNTKREKVNFNLANSICDIYSLIEPLFKTNNITLEKNCGNTIMVTTYKNDFDQVILNILSNAKDALIDNHILDKTVSISVDHLEEEHRVRIVISDNGGGIPEESLTEIFNPYFTTKNDGSGIGLYMTKVIIEKYIGGSVKAENKHHDFGYGACFTIELGLD